VGALISLIKRLFRLRHWTIYRPVLLIFRSRNRVNLSPSGQDISTNTYYFSNIVNRLRDLKIKRTGLYMVQWRNLKRRLIKEINAPTEHTPGNALK
jgi:hypothetical protein